MKACRVRTGQRFSFIVIPILLAFGSISFGWCATNVVPIISPLNSTKETSRCWRFSKSDHGRYMVAIVKSTSVFFCILSKGKSLVALRFSTRTNIGSISKISWFLFGNLLLVLFLALKNCWIKAWLLKPCSWACTTRYTEAIVERTTFKCCNERELSDTRYSTPRGGS